MISAFTKKTLLLLTFIFVISFIPTYYTEKVYAIDNCDIVPEDCTNHFTLTPDMCDTDPTNSLCGPNSPVENCPNPRFAAYLCDTGKIVCNDVPSNPYSNPNAFSCTGAGPMGPPAPGSPTSPAPTTPAPTTPTPTPDPTVPLGPPAPTTPTTVNSEKATYQLLAPILDESGNEVKTAEFPTYLRYMFIILISLASVIAVLMIVFGGVKYMTTDAYTGKQEGKEIIKRTLGGMILIIASWLIIYTINPNTVKLDATKGSIQNVKDGTPGKPVSNGTGINKDPGGQLGGPTFNTPQGGGSTPYVPPNNGGYTDPNDGYGGYIPSTSTPPTPGTPPQYTPPPPYQPGPGGTIPPIPPTSVGGWTDFETSGSNVVQVPSGGNVGNAIASGKTVLLQRGGTYNSFSVSASNVTIAYYGSGARPIVRASGDGIRINNGVSNLKIIGLHLKGDGVGGGDGIPMIGKSRSNILIEDNYIEGFSKAIGASPYPEGSIPVSNLRINRNVIVENDNGTRPQGIYTDKVNGLLIEENIFDSNGTRCKCTASTFDHNLYLQQGNTNVAVKGNIIARASSYGLQMRSGGIAENNLFLENPTTLLIDQQGRVANNVVLGTDYFTRDGTRVGGFGIEVNRVRGNNVTVENNIVAHKAAGMPANYAFSFGGIGNPCGNLPLSQYCKPPQRSSLDNVVFRNNIAYNWAGTPFDNNPNKPAPGFVNSGNSWNGGNQSSPRNLRTYVSEKLGGNGGIDAFMNEAKKQSRSNWRTQYTAAAVNDYIRQGYGR